MARFIKKIKNNNKDEKLFIIITIVILIVVMALAVYFYSKYVTNNTTENINGTNYTLGVSTQYPINHKVSNFLIQKINPNNITGLSYIEYPIALANGVPKILHIGDTVGYNCDDSLKVLTAIYPNYAIFTNVSTGSKYGNCPI